jgi:hypothetical protein
MFTLLARGSFKFFYHKLVCDFLMGVQKHEKHECYFYVISLGVS